MGHCWQEDVLSGQLLKSIDPQGGEWQYGYDELGRLIETATRWAAANGSATPGTGRYP
jgi:YD repeat-containing protein